MKGPHQTHPHSLKTCHTPISLLRLSHKCTMPPPSLMLVSFFASLRDLLKCFFISLAVPGPPPPSSGLPSFLY